MNINPWEIKQYKAQLKLNKLEQELTEIQKLRGIEVTKNFIGAETYFYDCRESYLKKEIATLKKK